MNRVRNERPHPVQSMPAHAGDRTARVMKWIALLLVAALAVSLIPLYGAARYSYAGVDDYRYGLTTHAVWAQTGSLGKTVAEAARLAGETYHTWQGSLSAIFLMALEPGIFGDGAYGVSTVILLTALVLAAMYFFHTLLAAAFCMERWTALALAALGTLCCVQFVPEPVESYYWFNGGIYYTFYFSVSLAAAALFIRRRRKKSILQAVLLALLMPLIGTGNLVTGLLSCVLLGLYGLWTCIWKKERDIAVMLSLILLLCAFAANALAPGNGVRQAEHAESARPAISAIFAAMGDAGRYTLRWLGTPAVYTLLAGVPLIWRWAGQSTLRFRFPPLISAASFLLLAAGFTPNEYALGFPGVARIIDVLFYLFVLLALVNVVWYTGWLRKHAGLTGRAAKRAAAAILAASLLLAGGAAVKNRGVAAVSALRIQLNGNGRAYAAVWEARLAMLRDPAQPEVVLEKFTHQPPLLCMVDIAVDETGEYFWYNEQLAAYFGKRRVLREP